MELLLAGPAAHLGQLVVGPVQDVIADVALLENVASVFLSRRQGQVEDQG